MDDVYFVICISSRSDLLCKFLISSVTCKDAFSLNFGVKLSLQLMLSYLSETLNGKDVFSQTVCAKNVRPIVKKM